MKDDVKALPALTARQARFVEEYLRCANGTEAAKRAGYSAKTAYSIASENLRKAEILQHLQARTADLSMAVDEVLARLADIGRGSMGQFLKIGADGDPAFDFRKARAHLHLIRKVKRTRETRAIGNLTISKDIWEVELYDAQAALVQLGKYHRLWVERLETDDWKREMANAGLDPDEAVKRLEDEFVTYLRRGEARTDPGGMAAGESES